MPPADPPGHSAHTPHWSDAPTSAAANSAAPPDLAAQTPHPPLPIADRTRRHPDSMPKASGQRSADVAAPLFSRLPSPPPGNSCCTKCEAMPVSCAYDVTNRVDFEKPADIIPEP